MLNFQRVIGIFALVACLGLAQEPEAVPASGVGGSPGATSISQLTDCQITKTAANVLTIASCKWIYDGGTLRTITNGTITVDPATTGVAYISLQSNGNLAVVKTGTLNVTCSGVTCDESAGTNYLADSAAIYTWSATAAVWDADDAAATEDARAIVRASKRMMEGVGINCTPSGADYTCDVDYAEVQSLANDQSGAALLCTGSASATAQTCTMTPALTALTPGMHVRWKSGAPNTSGAITLDLDAGGALAAKSIKKSDGTTDPSASEITTGEYRDLTYDGTVFRLPPAGGAASHVKKCYIPATTPNTTATPTVLASAELTVSVGDIIRVTAYAFVSGTPAPRWDVQLGSVTVVSNFGSSVANEPLDATLNIQISGASASHASGIVTRPSGALLQISPTNVAAGTLTGALTLSMRGSFAVPDGTAAVSIKHFCVEQLPATP